MPKPKQPIFLRWEREEWLPPPVETVDQWAERCIVLPKIVSAVDGPIDLSLTPFIREPLRAATDNDVEEITLCCSTQVMKTTFLIIVALHTISEDPTNIMHVMTTEDDAEELSVERYEPIIRASPELERLLDGRKHQLTRESIRLNGCVLTFRGAHSPAGLASRPVGKLFLDEVDKWPEWSGKEADPIKLARERTRTFWNRKIVNASTPTTARRYIWPRLAESTDERYWVSCPNCGHYQVLIMGGKGAGPGLKWPDGVDAEIIQREKLAWYRCEGCSGRVEESQKQSMIRGGKWAPRACTVTADGQILGEQPPRRHVGYHLWAIYSPWLTFSEIAAEFLRSKSSPSALMNFRNSWQAEPWETTVHELRDDFLRSCEAEYYQGQVDEEAMLLTAGVDVQSASNVTYQYYVIRAWGEGGRSWLVKCGLSEGWEVLHQILFGSDYKTPQGRPVPLHVVICDSGYKTHEVYEWCQLSGAYPSKGDVRGARHLRVSTIETAPGSGVEIPLINVHSDYFKTKLHRVIREPRRWLLPQDLDEEYYQHMTAEQRILETDKRTGRQKERWKVVSDGKPNHLFDCEVLALVGAELLQIQNAKPEAPNPTNPTTKAQAYQMVERIFS